MTQATDTRELEKELLAGLEGTTDGPWYWSTRNLCSRSAMITIMRDCWRHNGTDADFTHIARCSPSNIRALLATIADLRATVAEAVGRMTALRDTANAICGADPYDEDAQEAFEMFNVARDQSRAFTAKHGGSNAAE